MAVRSSRRRRRAVIVGGSMSGLFTAAFLRRIGWQVDVFERLGVELVGRSAAAFRKSRRSSSSSATASLPVGRSGIRTLREAVVFSPRPEPDLQP